MKKALILTFAISLIVFISNAQQTDNFVDSRDGKIYKIVKFGNQIWMAENFAYLPKINKRKYSSGDSPAYYVYKFSGKNTEKAKLSENYKKYGVLYNHKAAIEACPPGWHLPNDEEWEELETSLNQKSDKFFPKYGGRRTAIKKFYGEGSSGYWWSLTTSTDVTVYVGYSGLSYSDSENFANYRSSKPNQAYLGHGHCGKILGLSVRYVKDSE